MEHLKDLWAHVVQALFICATVFVFWIALHLRPAPSASFRHRLGADGCHTSRSSATRLVWIASGRTISWRVGLANSVTTLQQMRLSSGAARPLAWCSNHAWSTSGPYSILENGKGRPSASSILYKGQTVLKGGLAWPAHPFAGGVHNSRSATTWHLSISKQWIHVQATTAAATAAGCTSWLSHKQKGRWSFHHM